MSPPGMLVVQNKSVLKSQKSCDASVALRYMAPEIIRGEGYSGTIPPHPTARRDESHNRSFHWFGPVISWSVTLENMHRFPSTWTQDVYIPTALSVQQALRLTFGRWVWRMSQLLRAAVQHLFRVNIFWSPIHSIIVLWTSISLWQSL